ncbi:glycosyltransferase family 4 protein [Patescibacteria group bacterium AH-259-L07]|nr:glycosyltransferase family 4 protein [Patescibacteria group bacterium AH-259-L07]
MKNKSLVLFFTVGNSLKTWQEIGSLEREIKPYNLLATHFKKILFITYNGTEEKKFQKILASNIEILPTKIPFLSSKMYRFLVPFIYKKKLKRADIYKTNQMPAVIPALLAKLLYKKKLVVRCGYEWLRNLQREKKTNTWKIKFIILVEKLAYCHADRIIITSVGDKNFIQKRFQVPASKIEVIPNYIDTKLFHPTKTKPEPNTISFVGRLSPEKNLVNLLTALAGLKVTLVLFGNGPLKKELENSAKKLNVKVEFRGTIPNNLLPYELNKRVLFILPSLYEGNPKALLEAMACGLPCIGTNVRGIREIIQHKENGYLCETSAESIQKAIVEVLNNDGLRQKMGQNARKTILENFSLEKILDKEIKIYESL